MEDWYNGMYQVYIGMGVSQKANYRFKAGWPNVFKTRIQGKGVYPLWRRKIYGTQSNLEVSQSFRLFFNYLKNQLILKC